MRIAFRAAAICASSRTIRASRSNRGLRASGNRNKRHKQIGRQIGRDHEEQGFVEVSHAAISSRLGGFHCKRGFQAKFWTAVSVASRMMIKLDQIVRLSEIVPEDLRRRYLQAPPGCATTCASSVTGLKKSAPRPPAGKFQARLRSPPNSPPASAKRPPGFGERLVPRRLSRRKVSGIRAIVHRSSRPSPAKAAGIASRILLA